MADGFTIAAATSKNKTYIIVKYRFYEFKKFIFHGLTVRSNANYHKDVRPTALGYVSMIDKSKHLQAVFKCRFSQSG